MKSIKFLITLLVICFITNVLGQTKTAHTYKAFEIEKQTIENKALQKLGIPLTEINKLRKDKSGEAFYNTKNKANEAYIKKNGISLIALDEMVAKNKAINKYKDVIVKNICQELTEFKRAKLCIEASFKEWAKRGEYEKKEEYESRMTEKYEMIERISQDIIFDFVNKEMMIKTGKYNIDQETYSITFMRMYPFYLYNTKNALLNEVYSYYKTVFKESYPSHIIGGEYTDRVESYTSLIENIGEYVIKFPTYIKKIDRDTAKNYKTESEGYSSDFWNGDLYTTKLNNCIVYEGYFLPNKIEIKGQLYEIGLVDTYISDWTLKEEEEEVIAKMQKKANLKYPAITDLEFNTNDLGLSKYFPENYSFKVAN